MVLVYIMKLLNTFLPTPVRYSDYKPAIKVGALLELIRKTYPQLKFTDEFIQREELDEMYLWMNKKIDVGTEDKAAASFSDGAGIAIGNSAVINLANNAADAYAYNKLQYSELTNSALGQMNNYFIEDILTGIDVLQVTYVDVLLDKRSYTGKVDIAVEAVLVKKGAQIGEYHSLWKEAKKDVGTDNANTEYVSFNLSPTVNVYNRAAWDDRQIGDEVTFIVTLTSSTQLAGDVDLTVRLHYPPFSIICGGSPYVCGPSLFSVLTSTKFDVFATGYRDYSQLVPDMKVIDFLTGIFKLLNLTTYVDGDGNVIVEPLDEYYEAGSKIDLSRSVDMTSLEVSKALFYKDVTLKYLKSDDILSKNARSRSGNVNFPDTVFQLKDNKESDTVNATLSEGKNFKLEIPFSCIMYERLYTSIGSDLVSDNTFKFPNTITDMQVGHSLNDKIEKQDIKNLLFYAKQVNTSRSFIEASPEINSIIDMAGYLNTSTSIYEHGNTAGMYGNKVNGRDLILVEDPTVGTATASLAYAMTPLKDSEGTSIGANNKNHYWIPSNIMASRFRRNGFFMNKDAKYQGLQFGNKNDDEFEYYVYADYDSTDPNEVLINNLRTDIWINGMYDTFYSIYLKELYSERARIYKLNANLPSDILSTYSLKDTFIVNNREFTINKANINLMTGESKLELLTDIPDANNGALINNGSLEFVSYSGTTVTFKLTSIQLWNGEFPDTVKIYSGDYNSNVIYTITGLDASDYTDIGNGLYSLDSIITSAWINSATTLDPQTAFATLISANGAVSNNSNTISFINLADAPIPLASISLFSVGVTTLTFTLGGTDYSGSGIQTAELRYTNSAGPLITQFSYDGSPLNFELGGLSSGISFTVALQVTDGAGKESLWVTASGTTTGDAVPPEKPVLGGFASTIVTLNASNLVDDVEVVKWNVYRSVNSTTNYVLYAVVPHSTGTTGTYADTGVGGGNKYNYIIRSEDAAGNLSPSSNSISFIVGVEPPPE